VDYAAGANIAITPNTITPRMNPVALETMLDRHGLDEAAQRAFVDWGPLAMPTLGPQIEALAGEVIRAHLPRAEGALVARFCLALATLPQWDFSLAWLERVSGCGGELAMSANDADWVCPLVARLDPLFDAAPPPARAAARRVSLVVAAALLRACRARLDSERSLAAAHDEATGLYRSEQAHAQVQAWVKQGQPAHFAVCVLRVSASAVLLRLTAGLQRALSRQVTARLNRAKRVQDALFAGAEWEWLLLAPGVEDEAALKNALGRLLHAFDVPFDVFGREYRLAATAGATLHPAGGAEADNLMRSARIALHEASQRGLHFDVFRAEMDHSAARYAAIEHGFLEALREDKLEIYLQPQVDCAGGACQQAEALLRWSHAGGHTVAPQFIVEMAHEAGMQHNFARWLTTRAVRTLAELSRRGLAVGLSINLTAHDLADAELQHTIREALALWRVAASRLTIELTESAIIPDEAHSDKALAALRALGCRLAVDDFGTGYSSMAYLRQLPLNELKIDQLFVRRMRASTQDREIVRSMLQLAHGLSLEVVAEGVEDEDTAQLLREMGCHRMQGFLFGQAMPLAQFVGWMQARA